ncbi:hypothetical protein D9613_007262 [Agrocybe pediades]|uniref:Peregrin n=1 Tax=Agrocybe pediades TaxID=84607 RepID=A0A8H4QID9_9AGAR|nr:hypothetical protein D9613_007262 [Agrocybe pediades]
MARGNHGQASPTAASSLPKVEFQVIHDDKLKLPGGVHGKQDHSFGYNNFEHFTKPEHYIRHIEPLESDLAKTVEYDMDEQDQEWLDLVNVDRKKAQMDAVTPEGFEIIMDRLEKEWFDMTKNIPKPDFAMPSEDSTCAICDDSEGENSNAIVFCDGCNLAVHQDCYGVPYIPEGQWLCRKCTVSPENPVSCYLCPNEGGAFKQTTHGEWVHLLCAIWIPETRVANDVFMEPITGVERISKQRWKLRCSICDVREGACIQCTKPSCFVAFHATCARREKLLMPMKSVQGAEPASLTCFCDRHLPPEQQEIRAAAIQAAEGQDRAGPNASKSARAYAKTYKPGPPLVPAIIIQRIVQYITRLKIRKKQDFVQQMARYWSLKREARRGAPLLKRLHLEPWTASAGAKVLTEEEKLMRLDQLKRLRQDLVNVYHLTSLVRKREIRKQKQMEIIYEVLSGGLFPAHAALRTAFERIQGQDHNDHFKNPVSKHDVPDYFDIIKKPMCWSVIDTKLDHHQYWNLKDFRDDIELVLSNALTYNKSGTVFYKTAARIKLMAKPILDALEPFRLTHDPSSWSHLQETVPEGEASTSAEAAQEPGKQPFGDLEPPVDVLELFLSTEPVKSDLNMEVEDDPVAALFNYEFAKMKPIPVTPPTPPPAIAINPKGKKSKAKRDRKAEAERAKANKEARQLTDKATSVSTEHRNDEGAGGEGQGEGQDKEDALEKERNFQAMLDASAGFRAPRTRNALAAAVAFEAEALGGEPSSAATSAGPSHTDQISEGSRHKKRGSVVPVTQPSTPRVVDHVDDRDTFLMFNAGWIYPPDQKRGGRTTSERPPLPPPRKKQKTEHGGSISIVSTPSSENRTYQWDSIDMKPNTTEPTPMDVDDQKEPLPPQAPEIHPEEAPSASRAHSVVKDLGEVDEPLNVVTQPNGVVIIEKLDTPAIRRERNSRKKAERRKLADQGLANTDSAPASAQSGSRLSAHPPSSPRPHEHEAVESHERMIEEDTKEENSHEGFESDLSELSDVSDEWDEDGAGEQENGGTEPEPMNVVLVSPPKQPTIPTRRKKLPKGEIFEDGTIVWAKSDSYPWWPAVVHADSSSNVPSNILKVHKEKKLKRKIKLYIVQYYDKQASWQSVPRDKLQLLGEDKKLDEELLSKQKWKPSASKQLCREAYDTAIAEMDTEYVSGRPPDNANA